MLESLLLPKYPELQIRGGTEQQIIFWVIGYLTHQNNVNCVNTSQNLINRVKSKTGDVRVMILSVMKCLLKMDKEEACIIKAPLDELNEKKWLLT